MTGKPVSSELRKSLEKAIEKARKVAEAGTQDAIRRLGVADASAPAWLDDSQKALRRRLRAHARSLGDKFNSDTDQQEVTRLVGAAAYALWHRMLFARFLAERDLLLRIPTMAGSHSDRWRAAVPTDGGQLRGRQSGSSRLSLAVVL